MHGSYSKQMRQACVLTRTVRPKYSEGTCGRDQTAALSQQTHKGKRKGLVWGLQFKWDIHCRWGIQNRWGIKDRVRAWSGAVDSGSRACEGQG